jgi:hypothetical protein
MVQAMTKIEDSITVAPSHYGDARKLYKDNVRLLDRITELEADIATREEVYDAQSKIIEEQSARIAELEAENERLRIDDKVNRTRLKAYKDHFDANQGLLEYTQQENMRLRKAIEAAPHYWDCNIPMAARKDSESVMTVVMSDQCTIECTCWKREALGDE